MLMHISCYENTWRGPWDQGWGWVWAVGFVFFHVWALTEWFCAEEDRSNLTGDKETTWKIKGGGNKTGFLFSLKKETFKLCFFILSEGAKARGFGRTGSQMALQRQTRHVKVLPRAQTEPHTEWEEEPGLTPPPPSTQSAQCFCHTRPNNPWQTLMPNISHFTFPCFHPEMSSFLSFLVKISVWGYSGSPNTEILKDTRPALHI